MNFLRNRLVVLGLVLLATLLLYLLLPSIRQGSMEPSLEAQRLGLLATSPPALPTINVSVRTGQLPGDPPLFFREALPVDGAGRQILPRWTYLKPFRLNVPFPNTSRPTSTLILLLTITVSGANLPHT